MTSPVITIVGGAVNLASRIEHEAPPGGVLISYQTFALVKDEMTCKEQGLIRVKGIAYPVAVYKVGSPRRSLGATRDRGSDSPHFRLEFEPEFMTADERQRAATALRNALEKLGG